VPVQRRASPTNALGSGISQRAAAARTQTVWRWLVTLE